MACWNFPHAKTDTNMFAEAFHNRLKTHFMKRKPNRRIDSLINLLLEIEEEDYWRRQEDLAYQPTPKLVSDVSKHKKGLSIPDSELEPDPEDSDNWRVKSQTADGVYYTVTAIEKQCTQDHSFVKCTELACVGLCSHLYFCTCGDPDILCKHIHKVHSFINRTLQKRKNVVHDDGHDEDDDFFSLLMSTDEPVPAETDETDDINNHLLEKTKTDIAQLADMLNNPEVTRSLLPHISGTVKNLLCQCSAVISSKETIKETPQIGPNLNGIAPNSKLELQPMKKAPKRKAGAVQFKGPTAEQKRKLHNKLMDPDGYNSDDDFATAATLTMKTKPLNDDKVETAHSVKKPSLVKKQTVTVKKTPTVTVKKAPTVARNKAEVCVPLSTRPNQCKESSTTSNSRKTSHYTTTLSSKRRQDRFTPAITNAFAPDNRIIYNGPHSLTLLNLKSLEPALSSGELVTLKALDTDFRQGQLYDEILNSYFWLFSQRHPEIMYAPNTSMTALMSGSSCRLLWKDEHTEGKQYIFLPWNPTGDHWVLWVVDFARRKFMYLDPLRNDQDPARYPRYVIAAFQKLSALMFVKFNLSNTAVEYPFKCLQRDSISCGVMVCFSGHQIIMKKPLIEEMNTVLF